jgi:hypothetical protein
VCYLSSNSLHSLDGVAQLKGLRVLSAASNLLARIDSIAPLQACPRLEVLTLEGCPLMQLPNARARVIDALPQLGSLDGRAITPEERERAAAAVRAEAAALSVMLDNACLAHKLSHVARLLRVHTEMRRALFGPLSGVLAECVLPGVVEVDALKLLRQWDYARGMSEQVGGLGECGGKTP